VFFFFYVYFNDFESGGVDGGEDEDLSFTFNTNEEICANSYNILVF